MNVSDRILRQIHIDCGLTLSENYHVIMMHHNGRLLHSYPIEGMMSPDQILKDANDYIAKSMNSMAGGLFYRQKSIGKTLADTATRGK